MPLDFAAAICESDAAGVDVLDAFFIEPPAAGELAVAVAGAAGGLPAGAEVDIGAVALTFAADDLLLLAAAFELSAAAVPESAMVDFSVLFFLLLLLPVVLVLAESLGDSPEAAAFVSDFLLFLLLLVSVVLLLAGALEASLEDAALTSDFLLFLLLLFEELLLAVSELAELSAADVSDFFDFELFFDELESEFVLLVSLSELAFFFDFLLLVEAVPWSADVPDCVSWAWATATGMDNINNRHVVPAKAVNFHEKKRFIDMKPTFRSARLQSANSEARSTPMHDPEVRNSRCSLCSQKSSSPPSPLSTVRRTEGSGSA